MDESIGAARASRPRRGGTASPGMPETEADGRLADLESRLERLEGSAGLRERGRKVMDRVVPPEATMHFRNAGREQLLGIRTIVDHWIRRIDAMEPDTGTDDRRHRIEIE